MGADSKATNDASVHVPVPSAETGTGKQHRVLIAAPLNAYKRIAPALKDLSVIRCETLDEAIREFQDEKPSLVILGYVFDQMRPFRFVHHLRSDGGSQEVPIIMVQIHDWRFDALQEQQMREGYRSLGVERFFNFSKEAGARGAEAALHMLRSMIDSLIP